MINNKFRKKNLVKIILGPENILLSEKLCVENVKKICLQSDLGPKNLRLKENLVQKHFWGN